MPRTKKNRKAKKLVFAIIDGVEYKKPIINANEVGGVQEVDTNSHPTGNVSNLNWPPPLPTEKSVVSVDVSAMDPLPIPTFNFESNKRDHLKTNQSTSSDVMNPLFEDSYDIDKTLFCSKLSVSSLSSHNDDFDNLGAAKSDFKKQQEELHARLKRLESVIKIQEIEAKRKDEEFEKLEKVVKN